MLRNDSYYDPGNSVNYQLGNSSTTSATSSSSSTADTSSSTTTATTTTTTTAATTSATTTAPAGTGAVSASQPPAILPTSIPSEPIPTAPSGCGNFNGGDSCASGNVYTFPDSSENRRWQTPPQGHPAYVPTFQNMRDLVGYADIQYNAARTSAVVVVNAASRTKETLTYNFGGNSQASNTFQVSASFAGTLPITITSSSGGTLVLDALNFIWQNNALVGAQSTFTDGQKGGIVELFGWPYKDVASECTFLGKAGTCSKGTPLPDARVLTVRGT